MKQIQRFALISILLSIVCTSCVFNRQPSNAASETQTMDTVSTTASPETSFFSDTSTDVNEEDALSQEEIRKIIDENLAIFSLSDISFFDQTEAEYIAQYPEAFSRIVALGKDALPYLQEIGEEYLRGVAETYPRWLIAKAAEYKIKPESYDRLFPSPDGRYAIQLSVASFVGLMDPFRDIDYNVCMVACDSQSVIYEMNGIFNFPTAMHKEPRITWSDDSKYVAIEQGYRHDYAETLIYNTTDAEAVRLPDREEIERLFGGPLSYIDPESEGLFDRVHFHFEGFQADGVRIYIELSAYNGGGITAGYYTYDLCEQSISEIEFCIP